MSFFQAFVGVFFGFLIGFGVGYWLLLIRSYRRVKGASDAALTRLAAVAPLPTPAQDVQPFPGHPDDAPVTDRVAADAPFRGGSVRVADADVAPGSDSVATGGLPQRLVM